MPTCADAYFADAYLYRHLLNESWRMLLATTSIVLILLDAFFAYMTIFDVVRNQVRVCQCGRA